MESKFKGLYKCWIANSKIFSWYLWFYCSCLSFKWLSANKKQFSQQICQSSSPVQWIDTPQLHGSYCTLSLSWRITNFWRSITLCLCMWSNLILKNFLAVINVNYIYGKQFNMIYLLQSDAWHHYKRTENIMTYDHLPSICIACDNALYYIYS